MMLSLAPPLYISHLYQFQRPRFSPPRSSHVTVLNRLTVEHLNMNTGLSHCNTNTFRVIFRTPHYNQDTGHLVNQDTGHLFNQDTGHLVNHDTGHLTNQDTGHLVNQDTGHLLNQDTGHLVNQDTGHLVNQDTGHLTNQDTGHLVNQDTGHLVNQDTFSVSQMFCVPNDIFTSRPMTVK